MCSGWEVTGAVVIVPVRRNAMTGSSEGEAESSGAGLWTRLGSNLRLAIAMGSGGRDDTREGIGAGGGTRGPVAISSACRSIWTLDGVGAGATGLKGVNSQFLASEVKPLAPVLRRLDDTVEVERMDSCDGETLRRCDGMDRAGVAGVVSTTGKFNAGGGSGECPPKLGTAASLARLVDARLMLGFRTFLNGSVGMGWCG